MVLLKKQVLRKSNNLTLQIAFPQKLLLIGGPSGVFSYPLFYSIQYGKEKRKLWLLTSNKLCRKKKAFFGLNQVLINQVSLGVLNGYRKQLNIVGIGYQASIEKTMNISFLVLKLGFSHLIRLQIPDYLTVTCPKPRVILIKGMNLQKVSNFGSLVRSLKFPNPYKEKGIYYLGEKLQLKQGKKT